MSDPTPVDLSDLQLMPDWLKEGADKGNATQRDRNPFPHDSGEQRPKRSKKAGKGRENTWQERKGKSRNRRHPDDGKKGARRGDKGSRKPHDSRDRRNNRPSSPPPPEGITATLQPGSSSIAQLVEQIRKTARAYSVFDIARLVLASRDRYSVGFKRENENSPELFTCIPDQSAWLSYPEALANLLQTTAFSEHYAEEKVQGEMPKGNYTSIAICGISGQLLGPPNHHSYQVNISKLHRQRFSNMPIDKYKNKIRVENDEETIERWKNEQSIGYHYTYLKSAEGEDPIKFESREPAEKHFIEEHAESLIGRTDEAVVAGNISGRNLSPGLLSLLRRVAGNAQKHPASLVQPLCGMLGAEGLKFFKRGKKIFTCITRPKPLSDDSTLSKPILAIVHHIRKKKRASIKSILDELAPSPPANVEREEPATEDAEEPVVDNDKASATPQEKSAESEPVKQENEQEQANEEKTAVPENPELTEKQINVMKDVHWLLSQGAVIAFGDGHIELAKPRVAAKSTQEKENLAESKTTESQDHSQDLREDGSSKDSPET